MITKSLYCLLWKSQKLQEKRLMEGNTIMWRTINKNPIQITQFNLTEGTETLVLECDSMSVCHDEWNGNTWDNTHWSEEREKRGERQRELYFFLSLVLYIGLSRVWMVGTGWRNWWHGFHFFILFYFQHSSILELWGTSLTC